MAFMNELEILNNKGVHYIREGRFSVAIESLRGAISLAKNNCKILCGTCDGHHGPARLRRSPSSSLNPSCCCKVDAPALDELGAGILTTSFLLESAYCTDPIEDAKIVSAIIIFNMASAFHKKSVVQYGCQTEMKKAKSLYIHVYELLSSIVASYHAGHKIGSTGDMAIDLLYMAVLNNLAYCEFGIFGDKSKSCDLFYRLACYAISVRERFSNGTIDAMETHIDTFLQNAVFARSAELIAAPAA
jgi:hypothetical protein